MITDALLDIWYLIVNGFFASLNGFAPGPPAWAYDFMDGWHTVWGYVYDFDTWLPVTFGIVCFSAVVATYLAGLIIGGVRVMLSYATFGGNT